MCLICVWQAVNFFAPVALAKLAVTHFQEDSSSIPSRAKAIAVVSSVQGKLSLPLRSSYTGDVLALSLSLSLSPMSFFSVTMWWCFSSASKHAVQGYFASLQAEISKFNIHVTIFSPGYVRTSLSLHAITATGTAHGKVDPTTASGMSPRVAAKRLLLGIAQQQGDVVLADTKSVVAIYLHTVAPWLVEKVLKLKK